MPLPDPEGGQLRGRAPSGSGSTCPPSSSKSKRYIGIQLAADVEPEALPDAHEDGRGTGH